jgi:putative inorganic carbon (HCO3(-)) transporter
MTAAPAADRSRWVFYLLLVWTVALPWPLGANRDWIWPWFAVASCALAALAAATSDISLRWQRAHPGLRVALVALAAAATIDLLRLPFAGAADAAGWRSADPDAAALGALSSVTLVALASSAFLLIGSRRRARWLLIALFVCGLLQAALALTLTIGNLTLPWFGHRLGASEFATGTYINRNHFAGMIELAGCAGFGLLASGLHASERAGTWREWLRRVGHALLGSRFAVRVGLALLVVALVLTRSRMGNVAFFAGLTAAGVAALLWWRPLPRLLIWLLLSIAAVDVLVLGAWVGVDRLAERVAETRWRNDAPLAAEAVVSGDEATAPPAVSQEPTDAERWIVATAALKLWRERPWFGHGPGSFRLTFPSVKPESVRLFYEHAHNDYVETLVERGAVGFACWAIAAFALLCSAVQALRRRHDSLARGLALTTIAAATAYGLHSLVDFNLQIPANLFWFVLCMLAGALAHGLPSLRDPRTQAAGSVPGARERAR